MSGSVDDHDGPGVIISVVSFRGVLRRVEGVAGVGERRGAESERGVRRVELSRGLGVPRRGALHGFYSRVDCVYAVSLVEFKEEEKRGIMKKSVWMVRKCEESGKRKLGCMVFFFRFVLFCVGTVPRGLDSSNKILITN